MRIKVNKFLQLDSLTEKEYFEVIDLINSDTDISFTELEGLNLLVKKYEQSLSK